MEAVIKFGGQERRVEVQATTQAAFGRRLAAGELKAGKIFSIQPEISVIELSQWMS
jgi:hypothetical protein